MCSPGPLCVPPAGRHQAGTASHPGRSACQPRPSPGRRRLCLGSVGEDAGARAPAEHDGPARCRLVAEAEVEGGSQEPGVAVLLHKAEHGALGSLEAVLRGLGHGALDGRPGGVVDVDLWREEQERKGWLRSEHAQRNNTNLFVFFLDTDTFQI